MVKISLVSEVSFTITSMLDMKHFQLFTPKARTTGPTNPEEILDKWFQGFKSAYHWWRVPKNIRWAFLPNYQNKLDRHHTELWNQHGSISQLADLDYIMSIDALFKGLTRNSNTIYAIVYSVRRDQQDLILQALINGEDHNKF